MCFKPFALAICLVTAAASADEPSSDSSAAALGNVITREQLDNLNMKARFLDTTTGKEQEYHRGLSLGLFLPSERAKMDDPFHAYFVVKNDRPTPVGLDMRFDWFNAPHIFINSCGTTLTRPPKSANAEALLTKTWACGGPPHVVVPGQGYYCVRGDISCLGIRSPGEYKLHWQYFGALQSNEVRPIVMARPDHKQNIQHVHKAPRHYLHSGVALLRVQPVGEYPDGKSSDGILEQTYDRVEVRPESAGRFSAALATGVAQRWYPDLLDLPQQDDLLRATARWTMEKDVALSRKLEITLARFNAAERVTLPPRIQVWLMLLRQPGNEEVHAEAEQQQLEDIHRITEVQELAMPPLTQLKWHYQLPSNWTDHITFGGRARVAAIVTCQQVEMVDLDRKVLRSNVVRIREGFTPWTGVLRTNYVDLTLPIPKKRSAEPEAAEPRGKR